jgi:hypothetical protein
MHRRLAVASLVVLAALAAPGTAAANDPPVCVDTFYETERNTTVDVSGGCTDPDGPAPLSYSVVQGTGPFPGHLTNLDPAGSATYVPYPNYVGPDSFEFTATDGLGAAAEPATAHIAVVDGDGTNAAPVCPSPVYFVPVGSSTTLTGNCADADGDQLSYSLDSSPNPAVGTLALVPPASVVFTAVAEGSTSLGYHASDGQLNSNPATVFLNVVPAGGTEQSTGTEATPEDPAQASITTTATGSVIVTQVGAEGTTLDGLVLLPFQFNIEAPDGDPLTLRFTLDSSVIPAGQDESTIVVLRDGVRIAPCTGAGLGPDPCVSDRKRLPDGDVELEVLSSHASRWNFAVAPVTPKPGKGCGDKNHAHAREGACKKPAK